MKPETGSTHVYNQWRASHAVLSSMHWAFLVSLDAAKQLGHTRSTGDTICSVINTTVPPFQMPETVSEFEGHMEDRVGFFRLTLLVMCSAHFEDFLESAATLWLGINGYAKRPWKLTQVGESLGGHALSKDSVSTKLAYIEHLFGIALAPDIDKWKRFYGLRCVAAHTGGIATQSDVNSLGIPQLKVGTRIKLNWNDLNDAFIAANNIAKRINDLLWKLDQQYLEAEWLLYTTMVAGELPSHTTNPDKSAWAYLHEEYAISVKGRSHKDRIWRSVKDLVRQEKQKKH